LPTAAGDVDQDSLGHDDVARTVDKRANRAAYPDRSPARERNLEFQIKVFPIEPSPSHFGDPLLIGRDSGQKIGRSQPLHLIGGVAGPLEKGLVPSHEAPIGS